MPLDPLSDLNDVLNSAFSALGARTSGGQPAPPVGPSVAQQMQTAPERAGNMLMSALGPLGDAGRQVGEMMRTRSVDPRDLPLLAGNVLMGTMAPGGAEGGAAAHGTQSLEDIVAALARGVGRGEAHGTVANADVPQPSSLGYYGKSMWNPTVEMHYKNAGGTYAGKTQEKLVQDLAPAYLGTNSGQMTPKEFRSYYVKHGAMPELDHVDLTKRSPSLDGTKPRAMRATRKAG